jgi:hypothetical protein
VRVYLRLLAAVLGGTIAVSGCGGLGEAEPEIPPLTPEPGDPESAAGPSPTVPPADALAARRVLFRYLRAVAAGDTAACEYLTPEYEQATFGEFGGCRSGLAEARREFDPADLTALRGVTVPTGQAGPRSGEFTVRFADLRWRADPAQPGGLLAARFVLRKSEKNWLIRS